MFFRKRDKDDLSKTKEEQFWQWFLDHSKELLNVKTGREKICDSLHARLQKTAKGVGFLFGPTIDGKREFIISAEGISPLIEPVQKLISAAPDSDLWNFIAFRPRAKGLQEFKMGGVSIDPNKDIFFSYSDSGGDRMALKLYVRNYDPQNKVYMGLTFILLDLALGEYHVMTKLSLPEIFKLPENYKELNLIPFSDLPKAFDLRFSGAK